MSLGSGIVGGKAAEEDRYSFAAYLADEDDDYSAFCGGTVIADDVVVSAAHCAGDPYNVVVGRHDRNHEDGQVIGVAKELLHPGYDGGERACLMRSEDLSKTRPC